MGTIFSKLGSNLTKAGVQQPGINGPTQYYDSPQQATQAASSQLPSADAMLGPDVLNPNTTAPAMPKVVTPSFSEALDRPGALTSKGGVLSLILSGISGAAAGAGAGAQGDSRGGFPGWGASFAAGFQQPFIDAENRMALRRAQQDELIRQAQIDALPSQQAARQQAAQAQLANLNAETKLHNAQADALANKPDASDRVLHAYTGADGRQHLVMQRGDNSTYDSVFGDVNQKDVNTIDAAALEAMRKENGGNPPTLAQIGAYQKSKAQNIHVSTITSNDAKDIADAIENGDQPPTTQGLYRNAAPVRAELARRGYPLAKAETDWKATQRYMATLNGPQQVRLRQAIDTASDSLDKIDGLYSEWKNLAPVSGFKVANRAALVAMKNAPGRAGAVANALDAQIADLAAELGNVYMGGNSPTDHSLQLSQQNLKSEWGPEAFEEAMKQARANIAIRKNSITHGMPAGVSGNYMPQASGASGNGSPSKGGFWDSIPGAAPIGGK